MIAFFDSLSEILLMIGDFIISLIKTLLMVFIAIPKALAYLVTCVGFLPPFVLAVVTVCVAVCIANTILDGGKNG